MGDARVTQFQRFLDFGHHDDFSSTPFERHGRGCKGTKHVYDDYRTFGFASAGDETINTNFQ